jgi:hypothetical protein
LAAGLPSIKSIAVMNKIPWTVIKELPAQPKKIFLLDGTGALLSACFLLLLLAPFRQFFGMPLQTLYLLSAMPVVYALYSFCCFGFLSGNWRPFLAGIIFGNLLYFFVSFALVIECFDKLTVAGVVYFVLEMIVLAGLIKLEIKCYRTAGTS